MDVSWAIFIWVRQIFENVSNEIFQHITGYALLPKRDIHPVTENYGSHSVRNWYVRHSRFHPYNSDLRFVAQSCKTQNGASHRMERKSRFAT